MLPKEQKILLKPIDEYQIYDHSPKEEAFRYTFELFFHIYLL